MILVRVKARTVSFREIEEAHKRERAADARALRSGRTSARELQETNSFIPKGAAVRIANLASYVNNRDSK